MAEEWEAARFQIALWSLSLVGHVHPLSTDIAKIPDSVVIYGLAVAFYKSRPLYLLLVTFLGFLLAKALTSLVTSLPITPYLSRYLPLSLI